jgi:hypothetical protein
MWSDRVGYPFNAPPHSPTGGLGQVWGWGFGKARSRGNCGMEPCISALRALAAIALGPGGRAHTICANACGGAITVTSTSHRIFDAVWLEHPAARAVVQLLAARQARGADGGLLTVLVASELIMGAARRRLPARLCATLLPDVLAVALRAVLDDVLRAALPLRISDLPALLAIVRTVLAPKRVALPGCEAADVEKLALLIVTAFVRSLPDHGNEATTARGSEEGAAAADDVRRAEGPTAARAAALLPGVRPLHVIGQRLDDSELLDGLLLDTPVPLGARLPDLAASAVAASGLLVALYNINLEATVPEGVDASVGVSVIGTISGSPHAADEGGLSGEAGAVRAESLALLSRFADGVAAVGVRVLCCQKRISPLLVALLLERHVLPLPRLSLRHVGSVRRLSGAVPLAHLTAPQPAQLGRLGGLETRTFGSREYVQLLPPVQPPERASPVVTLVLHAPNRVASEELAAAVSCALGTIGAAVGQRRPRILPGGGCTEYLLAAQLRRDADDSPQPALLPRPPQHASGSEAQGADAVGSAARARAVGRLRRETCLLLAEALEGVVAALAGGGQAGAEALERLADANSSDGSGAGVDGGRTHSFFGWDVESGSPMEVLRAHSGGESDSESDSESGSGSESESDHEGDGASRRDRPTATATALRLEWADVAELESEKLQSVHSAIDVACSIIGVDGIVTDTR